MAASNLNLGKASGGVLNVQPADGTTTTSLILPAINGTVVAADSNGNVGIGVTPRAWQSGIKAFDLGNAFMHYGGGTNFVMGVNAYYNIGSKYTTSGYATSYTQEDGAHYWKTAPSGTAGNTITWTNAMTLDNSGNMGIGVTPSAWDSARRALEVGGGSVSHFAGMNTVTMFSNNTYRDSTNYKYKNNGYAQVLSLDSNGSYLWNIAPTGIAGNTVSFTNVMTLDTNGRLDVNPIGNSGAFRAYITGTSNVSYESKSSQVASTNWLHFYGLSSNGTVANIAIYGNGNVVNANNSYGSLSDIKLKENIVDATPKLDKLMKIRVVNYNLIGDTQKQIGVIAQEIEKIFPGVIDEVKDTKQVEVEKEREVTLEDGTVDIEKYTEIETVETGETTKNVKYSVIYMMMLKGLQELNDIVKEQNEIIKDLKSRIEILEAK